VNFFATGAKNKSGSDENGRIITEQSSAFDLAAVFGLASAHRLSVLQSGDLIQHESHQDLIHHSFRLVH
jgi:hypothetical protein